MYKLTLIDVKTNEEIDTVEADADTAREMLEGMVQTGLRAAHTQINEMLEFADHGHKSTYMMCGLSGNKFTVELA